MQAVIPIDPADPEGATVTLDESHFEVLGDRGDVVVIQFHTLTESIDWFEDFELMYCERQPGSDIIRVVRLVTDEELRKYRIPLWMQGEEVPECCGRPKFFVGQIDDDDLCREPPQGATVWWHDLARFYVFTCPYCPEVKAVGQQF